MNHLLQIIVLVISSINFCINKPRSSNIRKLNPVVKSEPFYLLTQDNLLGISMSFGTPEQELMLTIDIGSEKTWIYKLLYRSDKSSTFSKEGTSLKQDQDLFTITGEASSDKLTYSEIELDKFNFILVDKIEGNEQFLGGLALGRVYEDPKYSFLNILTTSLQSQKAFSLQFKTDENKGILHIGDLKEEIKTQENNIDSCPLINDGKTVKWGCKLASVFIGNFDYKSEDAPKEVSKTDNKTHYIVDPKNYTTIILNQNAYFETIYNKIYGNKEFKEFLEKQYFVGEREKACETKTNEATGETVYVCSKSFKSKFLNLNFVFEGGLNLVIPKEDQLICNADTKVCEFVVAFNNKITNFAFGISLLRNYHTFFFPDDTKLYFLGEEKKFMVSLSNITPETSKGGIGVLGWFFIVLIIIIVIAIILRCTLRRKTVTKKLIEDQIYSTFE